MSHLRALGGFAIDESELELSDTNDILGNADFAEDILTPEELTKLHHPCVCSASKQDGQEVEEPKYQLHSDGQPATPSSIDKDEGAADSTETLARATTAKNMAGDAQDGALATMEMYQTRPKDKHLAKQVPTMKEGLSPVLRMGSSTVTKGKCE